jgi:hypothetical protein
MTTTKTPRKAAGSAYVKLKGEVARNWFAAELVRLHGEAARDKCCGPMLAAVEAELRRQP